MFERSNWIWLLIALLLMALVLAVPVGGRKGSSRIAAPSEKNYSGTVEAVNQHTCEICNKVEASVILITGPGRLEVRLGLQAFLEEHDFHLSRGDPIEVTGIGFIERGKNVVLANEVQKAGESLVLRGKHGKPAWIGAHGYTCPVCGN